MAEEIVPKELSEATTLTHVYLYGFVDRGEETGLGIPGLDGINPLYSVACGEVGCVVSEYMGEAMASLSREGLVRSLLRHQEAIERVMQGYTVVPVKFGTLLESKDEVRALLHQRHNHLTGALASMKDKVEIDVAATWDTARVLQEIGQETEVLQAKERMVHGGPPTVAQQVRLGQMVKASMDRRRSVYRGQMGSFLGPVAMDMLENVLISDEMVMNIAFLVERSRQLEFDAAVQRLDSLFRNEINFRVVGPLPPYSFSTVEVTRLTPGQIEDARQVLQLNGATSVEGIRRAYRRLAALTQQSLMPDNASAQGTLGRLRYASDLLLQCCAVHSGGATDNGDDAFAVADGGNTFVVSVKRAASMEMEPARFGGTGGHW